MKKETVKKKTSTKTKKEEVVSTEEQNIETPVEEIIVELTEGEKIAQQLKKEHGEVFITKIAGLEVIWRKLKRSEYKEAMTIKFSENEDIQYFERQEFMAKKVILYPENVDRLLEDYAGIADIVATETMIKTGFGIANTKAV